MDLLKKLWGQSEGQPQPSPQSAANPDPAMEGVRQRQARLAAKLLELELAAAVFPLDTAARHDEKEGEGRSAAP